VAHPMLPSRPHGTGVKGWLVLPEDTRRDGGDAVRMGSRGLSWVQDFSSEGTDMGTDVWVVALIGIVLIFGATKLPQLARNLGKAQGEFKKGLKEGAPDEDGSTTTPAASPTPPAPSPTPPAQASNDQPEGDPPTA
jgi:sec-independent protein translocase protein TatA